MTENTFAGCAKLGFESNVAHERRFYANTFLFEDNSILVVKTEEENGRTTLSTARISEER